MSQGRAAEDGASIVIIGGGIIGMSIAWRLAQQNWRVAVFDKSSIGGEASWAGAGMLSPGGEVERPSTLSSLAIESRRLYRGFVHELETASGLAIDYQECGGLDLAYSPDQLRGLEERAAAQARIGIHSKAVAVGDVSIFWPRVRSQGLLGARFYPDDGIVNPREVMLALAAACKYLGVSITQDCAVSWVEVSAEAVAIETAQGFGTYGAAVIAAGAWSSSIRVGGVPPLPSAEPVKGQLIGYQQPQQTCNTILRSGHTYLLQRANGLLIVGASVEHAGFDRETRPDVIASLAAEAGFILPHLRDTTPSEAWAGFRPSSDALHVGSWNSLRLYLAYGHYRNGILLAPSTARHLCSEITASLGTR